MKTRIFIALLLSAAAATAETPAIQVTANPAEFPAGRSTRVSIKLTKKHQEGGISLPAIRDAVWHTDRVGISTDIRFVNGKGSRSATYTLPLTVSTPGEVVIPPIKARFADGTTGESAPVKLRVLPPGDRPEPAVAGLTGRIVVDEKRSHFYVGEAIPVELKLAIPPRTAVVDIAFPKLDCGGPAVMPDYRDAKHPHYRGPVKGVRDSPTGRWSTLTFSTRPRFMRSGDFTLTATEQAAVEVPGDGDAEDDPFFNFGLRPRDIRRVRIDYPAVKLKVLPTPPAPAGVHPVGIFPDAEIGVRLSAATARKNEPLELRVELTGGALHADLTPPELKIPGFRIYPPEHGEEEGARIIRYVLIPLTPGEHRIETAFAIFDTAAGRWKTAKLDKTVAVTAPPGATADAPSGGGPASLRKPKLLPVPGKRVELPLFGRGAATGATVFGVLALTALAIAAGGRWLERRRTPEAVRRRAVARLIRRVKNGESVNRILREGGTETLARSFGMPGDSAPGAIAEHVGDGELREVLEQLDRNTFAPEAERRESALSPQARGELIRLFKRTLLFALLLSAFAAPGAEDPAACYNAGVEALGRGELPEARLHMERAHRLAPRSRTIRKGLETVEVELAVPVSPRNIRDLLRPDEYLLLAGIMFGGALIAFALRKVQKYAAGAAAAGMAAIGAAAVALAWSQCFIADAPYRADRAIVIPPSLELSSLPAARGGHAVGVLKGGTRAEVIEERGDFLRLRAAGTEGWCRRSGAERVFPKR